MGNASLIGIIAGIAAAFVFGSAAMPSALAKLLFLLVPLPIAIAGLGWGFQASFIATLTAIVLLALIFDPGNGLVFGLAFAGPAAWLAYLLLLGRRPLANGGLAADGSAMTADDAHSDGIPENVAAAPSATGNAPSNTIDWYPVGRVVAWAAALAAVFAVFVTLAQGQDLETYQTNVREALQRAVFAQLDPAARSELGEEQLKGLTDLFVSVMPAMVAMMWLSMMLFNLWLAGRVTRSSQLLARPWPDLSAMRFPALMALALAMAVLASLGEGMGGLAATGVSGALLLAFMLLGLSVVHAFARASRIRGSILGLPYIALLILPRLAAPALIVLALVDQLLDLRSRFRSAGGQPPTNTPPPGQGSV